MRTIVLAMLILAAGAGWLQIARPQPGYMLDSEGVLRPVLGVPAAAALGDPAAQSVSSFACTSRVCLVKSDGTAASGPALISFAPGGSVLDSEAGTSIVAPSGPAIIAMDSHSSSGVAWIFFQGIDRFARWENGLLTSIDFAPGGKILSLRAAPGGFDYAISRDPFGISAASIWIEHYSPSDGSITVVGPAVSSAIASSSPGTESANVDFALMLCRDGVLLVLPDQVLLNRSDGTQLTFPFPSLLSGPVALYAAGKGYIEIAAKDASWILRTDPGKEELAMLPGAASSVSSRPARPAPRPEKVP